MHKTERVVDLQICVKLCNETLQPLVMRRRQQRPGNGRGSHPSRRFEVEGSRPAPIKGRPHPRLVLLSYRINPLYDLLASWEDAERPSSTRGAFIAVGVCHHLMAKR